MALIRIRLLVGTGLAMLAVAVAALPPRPVPESRGDASPVTAAWHYTWNLQGLWWWPPQHAAEANRSGTRSRLRSRLAALDRGDSIVDAARRAGLRAAGGRVTVLTDGGIGPDSAAAWGRLAEEELAVFPVAASEPVGVPVIVALRTRLTPREGREGSSADRYPSRRVIEAAGANRVCIVLLEIAGVPSDLQRDLVRRRGVQRPRGQFLGPCALRGRYGMPGRAGVQLQLDLGEGSWRSAGELVRSVEYPPGRLVGAWASELGSLGRFFTLRACQRGDDARCGDLISVSTDRDAWYFAPRTSLMLAAHLLQTRPADQFQRLWRSDARFNDAVAEAYGRSAGAIIGILVRERLGAPAVGPLPRPSALLVSLAWALGLVAIGGAVAQRRQVRY